MPLGTLLEVSKKMALLPSINDWVLATRLKLQLFELALSTSKVVALATVLVLVLEVKVEVEVVELVPNEALVLVLGLMETVNVLLPKLFTWVRVGMDKLACPFLSSVSVPLI